MKPLPSLLLLTAGCSVMVNGKPHRIGGSDPTPVATTAPIASPAATTAPVATGGTAPAAPAAQVPTAPGQVIAVDNTLTAAPLIVNVGAVAFDSTFSKQFGSGGRSPGCGSEMTARPVASLELKQSMDSLEVTLEGGTNDGFVLARGKSLWFACISSIGSLPTISKLAEGWQPGRYDIYALSRYSKREPKPFVVELADASKPAVWPAKLQTITIAGKLAAPMLVEVTTQPNRRKLREQLAGYSCAHAAFPSGPDLALVIERPIPGLVVRPLPSVTPVTLRRELRDAKRPDKGCPTTNGGKEGASYQSEHELRFTTENEGTYGISLGTADAAQPTTVTLMIFDKSTKLDPLAPFAFATDTLEQRWLGYHFPQLDLDELDIRHDYARAELAAKVFALAPKSAFVYAKLDLDKDIAQGLSESFPKKNEPLLVLATNREQVEVLAADGLRYHVKDTHLVLAPESAPAVLGSPRTLERLDVGTAEAMLPPSAKNLATARGKRLANYQQCVDRVWAPYSSQLPTYSHPAGVDIVIVETPRERRIKEQGGAAVDHQCGTDAAVAKQTEVERVKMVAEIAKARAKLLAQATAAWR